MSTVLIIKQDDYKCSCGARLVQKDLNHALCPGCGEQLKEVVLESRYVVPEKEIEELKNEVKELGIGFNFNIGYDKLKQRIEDYKEKGRG